ncbi:MAG: histidinol-phosphate transaminase [Nitrospirales bacterium]|nr:histidinol-phosphate transaminase [Nitrospirales bacterium]
MPLSIHPTIEQLVPYSPGKPIDELERELGIQGAIKLASNENPLGPSPKAIAALNKAALTLNRYPDGGAHHLTKALAARWHVLSEQVVVGNGSDEIISLLVKAFLSPGDEVVMADHTFVMYKLSVLGGHGVPREVPLKHWRHDLAAMADAITDRTRLLFVCNPNNPTGTMVTASEVDDFLAHIPDHVIVVFDEAYYEYVCDPTFPESIRLIHPNRPVILLRTFSKIYGLAGLRIGYGITTPKIAGYLQRVRPPFNTNTLAQTAALAALADDDHVATSRALNRAEMMMLEKGLRQLGLEPLPSQANFLYVDVNRDGKQVFDALLQEGIIIRHIRGSMIRVTVGQPGENSRFLQALEPVLQKTPLASVGMLS